MIKDYGKLPSNFYKEVALTLVGMFGTVVFVFIWMDAYPNWIDHLDFIIWTAIVAGGILALSLIMSYKKYVDLWMIPVLFFIPVWFLGTLPSLSMVLLGVSLGILTGVQHWHAFKGKEHLIISIEDLDKYVVARVAEARAEALKEASVNTTVFVDEEFSDVPKLE